jgi:hypothetical protein
MCLSQGLSTRDLSLILIHSPHMNCGQRVIAWGIPARRWRRSLSAEIDCTSSTSFLQNMRVLRFWSSIRGFCVSNWWLNESSSSSQIGVFVGKERDRSLDSKLKRSQKGNWDRDTKRQVSAVSRLWTIVIFRTCDETLMRSWAPHDANQQVLPGDEPTERARPSGVWTMTLDVDRRFGMMVLSDSFVVVFRTCSQPIATRHNWQISRILGLKYTEEILRDKQSKTWFDTSCRVSTVVFLQSFSTGDFYFWCHNWVRFELIRDRKNPRTPSRKGGRIGERRCH